MTYRKRLTYLVFLDSAIVLSAIYLSYLTLHPNLHVLTYPTLLISSITLLISHHIFSSLYRLYNKAWEYASIGELTAIVKAVTFSILTTAVMQLFVSADIYVRALMITWLLHVVLIGGSRFMWRVYRDQFVKTKVAKKRALIIGAGSGGLMVVHQLLKNVDAELQPVGFIDDDPAKYKLEYYGISVVGNSSNIKEVVKRLKIDNIVIAIPSLNKKDLNRIFEACSKTKAKTQIMPKMEDIITGKVSVNQFRDVQVEDLLGREQIKLDSDSIADYLTAKTVLITGAGGSIGSEICRQVSKFHPKKLVLVGHGENSIYQIDMELRKLYQNNIEIIPVIGDVQDRTRMFEVMEEHTPDVVYHAAAHKHVPMMEYNPKEAVKNNVIGTKNVAEASETFGVKTFVMVSTDKAVNPTNVMGATKRIAEMIVQNLGKQSKSTRFVAVRFGNVLGSRGSVIPLFKKQIQAGGPITVTHPDITRYFMTIPEASRLVMQAGALASGGEIFVLDMGEPVKIVDLAKNLIKLSGYREDEIKIQFSGLRPGEKMYEELLNEGEIEEEHVYPKIHVGKTVELYMDEIYEVIRDLDMPGEVLRERVLDLANNRVKEKHLVG